MTKYPDESILILPDEKSGVDGLINVVNMHHHHLYSDAYSDDKIVKFIEKWMHLNVGYMERERMVFTK